MSGPKLPTRLAGGKHRIAKVDGDAPVQAYIAAPPGWKSDAGYRHNALDVRSVPGPRKSVEWNSPPYGVERQGRFPVIHCVTTSIKVALFRGLALRPVAPAGILTSHRPSSVWPNKQE